MCYRPITLKKTGCVVPCGRCHKCIKRRVSAWSFRLLQEEKVSLSAHFLTLTYDTKFVPIKLSGKLSLCKRHIQLFIKRLRKSQCGNGVSPIRYYGVGEYGGHTERPHYHIILFNAKPELIQAAWSMGEIHFGKVSSASVGYTLKYMMKNKKKMKSWLNGREPEFAVMSKGLGISYLSEEMCNWHIADLTGRMFCGLPGGVKIGMPRYYKDKLYFDLERSAISAAYTIIADKAAVEKMDKQSVKDFINEQKAIDASFDRMYSSSLKTIL
ncbi:MAG: replication initiator protein [Microviridae sp.]|nr:MAG: replication initiator protein [Microviridae sp.]